jgi:hypothetical protein
MVMMTVPRCIEVARGNPDVTSSEFRNAVSTMNARIKASKCPGLIAEAEGILSALLAHGEPQMPAKKSAEEIADIRREAGRESRMASCKNALRRKLDYAKNGFVSVTDRKPTVFEAALEMVEDEEVTCVYHTVDQVYSGPISEGGRRPVKRVTIARPMAQMRGKEMSKGMKLTPRPCPWRSERRQKAEEAQI